MVSGGHLPVDFDAYIIGLAEGPDPESPIAGSGGLKDIQFVFTVQFDPPPSPPWSSAPHNVAVPRIQTNPVSFLPRADTIAYLSP